MQNHWMCSQLVQPIDHLRKGATRDEYPGGALHLLLLADKLLQGMLDESRGGALIRIEPLQLLPYQPDLNLVLQQDVHLDVPAQIVRQEEGRTDRTAEDIDPPSAPRQVVQRKIRRHRCFVGEQHKSSHDWLVYHRSPR